MQPVGYSVHIVETVTAALPQAGLASIRDIAGKIPAICPTTTGAVLHWLARNGHIRKRRVMRPDGLRALFGRMETAQ